MSAIVNNNMKIDGVESCLPKNENSLKHVELKSIITIPQKVNGVKNIVKVLTEIEIDHTNKSISNDINSELNKLIINGRLVFRIKYNSFLLKGIIHTIDVYVKFNTFLYLHKDINKGKFIILMPYIEDVLIEKIDSFHIFEKTKFLLDISIY